MNTMVSRLTVAVACVAASAVWPGCSGTRPPASSLSFEAMDADHDGRVSKAEYTDARFREAFGRLDAKGDGVITLDEWKRFDTSPESLEHFRQMDENGDDRITLPEFLKLAPRQSNLDRLFGDMDADRDQFLLPGDLKRDSWLELFSIRF